MCATDGIYPCPDIGEKAVTQLQRHMILCEIQTKRALCPTDVVVAADPHKILALKLGLLADRGDAER